MAASTLYGFLQLADLANERVTTVGEDVVSDAIQRSAEEHNRQITALTELFAMPTQKLQTRFQSASARRLQPLDENGRARLTKPGGHYNVAFPVQMAGDAWGANWVTRAKMTVADANRITSELLTADAIWMRDHILAALFASSTWTFADPDGDLTIQPLANGDSVTYNLLTGATTAAADTHQYAQANAIDDGADNPYPVIYSELTEHPENSGQVVVLISSSLKATTEALATFHKASDPNLREGANSTVLTGSLGVAVPGTVIGYEDSGVWVVEWPSLPAGYMVATTTGGDRPLAMREDPEPELRGFKMVGERSDHPFWESQWARRAGFGAWNRVGAMAVRIGNGTYAVPTGYDAPMP